MKRYIVGGLIFLLISSSDARTNEDAGTCVGQFLKLGAGARTAGMGEAFSAVADDVNAIYWNPAGLMQVEGKNAAFTHNEWLYDLKYEFLAYCQPVNMGMGACSITYLRMGDMEGKNKDDNPTGNFGAYDYAISIAYAIEAKRNIYAGITGKIIRQKIENSAANGIAIDIGILRLDCLHREIKISAVLQNLGTKLKFVNKQEKLPLTYKFGLSYTKDKLTLASDITKPEDNNARINLGLEYIPTSNLAFRLGYNSQNDLDSGLTYGAGWTLKALQIDYAFIPYGKLDNSHRFSVTKRF